MGLLNLLKINFILKKIKSFFSFFDARDVFVLTGFLFLFVGVAYQWTPYIAMVATGIIILVKGLTKWV